MSEGEGKVFVEEIFEEFAHPENDKYDGYWVISNHKLITNLLQMSSRKS